MNSVWPLNVLVALVDASWFRRGSQAGTAARLRLLSVCGRVRVISNRDPFLSLCKPAILPFSVIYVHLQKQWLQGWWRCFSGISLNSFPWTYNSFFLFFTSLFTNLICCRVHTFIVICPLVRSADTDRRLCCWESKLWQNRQLSSDSCC